MKRILKIISCSVALLVVGFICLALWAVGFEQLSVLVQNQFELTEFEVRDDKLLMSKVINSQTLKQFEEIIAENPNITTLVELEVEGSMDDDTMIALSYRVRELGLNTYLTSTSEIYSGGVDLFLAGVERTMEPGAIIGVHSWSDGVQDAKDFPKDAPEHEQNRAYIEQMLGDDSFYWFTIYAAPADEMYVMTVEEIAEYGLVTK